MVLITGSLIFDLGLVALAAVCALYIFAVRNFNIWMKKGIPFQKPTAFFGNFKDSVLARKSMGSVLHDIYNQSKGKPYIGIFIFDQPMLVVRDVEIVKSVLVKDFNHFMNRNFTPSMDTDPLAAKGLFGLHGQRWKHLRMKLTPTFTSGKMKMMFEFVDECGKELKKYLEHSDDSLDIKDAMARYTTDVIATTIFGIKGNALKDPDSEFRRILKRVFEFSVYRNIVAVAAFFAPAIVSAFKMRLIDEHVNEFIRKTIWDTVDYRVKNGVVRKDFLELLIQIKNKGHVEDDSSNGHLPAADKEGNETDRLVLEGDDFVAQAFGFLTAGFETSSTTMSFVLYEMALHPEIQKKTRDEINLVMANNDNKITYDGLQEMVYLNNVISEALRKYPVLPFLDRRVSLDYTLPGSDIVLEKDMVVLISVLGLHMDPAYYPEPDRFDPDRFTEENKRLRPNYAYLPFGEGPRNCIGSRMGLMQAKVGLAHIISEFEVSPVKNTPIPLVTDPKSFLMTANGALPLAFKKVK